MTTDQQINQLIESLLNAKHALDNAQRRLESAAFHLKLNNPVESRLAANAAKQAKVAVKRIVSSFDKP